MTLADNRVHEWPLTPLGIHDYSDIADFLASTGGLGGRKFAADSRDVAEQLDSVLAGSAVVLRDELGRVRGYSALHQPHGSQPELLADFVFDPDTPPNIVDDVVGSAVSRLHIAAEWLPGAFLRAIAGADQQAAVDGLLARGARKEADFIRTRKPLHDEDITVLANAAIADVEMLSWSEVIDRGLSEDVRRLQYDTFLEHFGNMSKTPEDWRHHIHSRSFAPDFSLGAVDVNTGEVVGYALGSVYTAGAGAGEEHSAHTDYIGVRQDWRRRGLGELLLRKIWLAARRRGLLLASLGTDVNNRSNAHLLYRRLGYIAVEQQSAYRIDHDQDTE